MEFTEKEIYSTYSDLTQKASPWGAVIGAIIGAIPAIALYAFFAHMGAILYVFILIPPALIGLAGQVTGQVYQIQHRVSVGIIAAFIHLACVYYFQYKVMFYFLVPIIFFMALSTSKRRLNRLESLVVDMQSEGRFSQHE